MRYVQTAQCNDVLGAPKGATHDECGALPIVRAHYPNGQQVVASFWKPDAEELKRLNAGESIYLILWGVTMPPAALGVGDSI